MQILEVKNNIAKIKYNPAENKLLPSDFLLIEDANQKLIAQVVNIETTDEEDCNLAVLRLALNIDKEDNLSYFNGYIPAKSSKLIYITPDEIIELIKGNDDNIYFGNLSNHPSCFVKTNMSFVDDGLYIQSDREDKTQIIFKNIISELKNKNKKIIIIDFNGQYSSATNVLKLKISENIKLPLNIEAFDTILKYDVADCPIEDIAVIQSIVLELREYLKTLKDKYIPFNVFKKVVDDEFATNPVSGLMLLRNKLWLYSQDGIFADNKEEFDVINSQFFNQNIIIVDASDIAEKWFKFIIETVSELTSHDCYLFLSLNDVDIDKKSIINLYNKQNIVPVITTTYDNTYRPILKSLCKNQLLFKPSAMLQEQEFYSPLMERMNNADFLIFGETTLYMPLQLELQPFDSETSENVVQNDIKKDVDKLLSSPQTVIPTSANILQEEQEDIIEELEDTVVDELEEIDEVQELLDEDEDITDSDFDFLDEIEPTQQQTVTSNDDDDILNVPFDIPRHSNVDEVIDSLSYGVFEPVSNNAQPIPKVQSEPVVEDVLDSLEFSEDELITEENDISEPVETVQEIVDEEQIIQEEVENIKIDEASEELQENDDMSSIDDVIDDITSKIDEQNSEEASENEVENNEQEQIEEKELVVELEEDNDSVSKPVPPPISESVVVRNANSVPIYETDMPKSLNEEELPFKVGDRVFHPKHGNGTIEAFANYSNKILFCHIDFDKVGRRILDPRLSGIEKISII